MTFFSPTRLCVVLLATVLALSAGLADAANPAKAKAKDLGTFESWKAYSYEENGQKVCYMSSKPASMEPKGKVRGDAYILVTHRPAEKSFNVVSIAAGYQYKKGSDVSAKIGSNIFMLFTDGDTAWARDDTTDKALSGALRNGKTLVIKGTSARGTKTTDTYNLKGAGAAYSAIGEACGVRK